MVFNLHLPILQLINLTRATIDGRHGFRGIWFCHHGYQYAASTMNCCISSSTKQIMPHQLHTLRNVGQHQVALPVKFNSSSFKPWASCNGIFRQVQNIHPLPSTAIDHFSASCQHRVRRSGAAQVSHLYGKRGLTRLESLEVRIVLGYLNFHVRHASSEPIICKTRILLLHSVPAVFPLLRPTATI
jgi:hypothetical protein